MHSLPNLLLYVALCASFLHLSSAAPAAACVVSYYVTTYLIPATPNPTTAPTLATVADIVSTLSDVPVLSSTTAADPPVLSSTTAADPSVLSPTTAADPPATTTAGPHASSSTTPTLPTNGGGTELPSPTAALKYVTVGRGVQNYTCSAAGAVPVAIGAFATLYDVTSVAQTSESVLNTIPPTLVYIPISLANGSTLALNGVGTFPMIGHHYFAADGTPTFSLSAIGDILSCKKIASVNAPVSANNGPDGTGAVPWLMLEDKGGSGGLSQVYRVVIAGGKAPATCLDTNLISIQYAAEYWFFG